MIACVAPKALAASSLLSATSTAMIGEAPATRAPCTEFKPTPPQPMTTTLRPTPTPAVLTTAPKPVSTPQAMSEATSNGMSAGTEATWLWWTTTCSAKAPMRMPWTMLSPSLAVSGLCRSSGNTSSQNTGAPPEHEGQKPQERISVATTGSPTFRRVTPGPTASTIPAASWP